MSIEAYPLGSEPSSEKVTSVKIERSAQEGYEVFYPDVDIDALLSQMTLDEKLSLTSGSYFWGTSGIERLNVPALKVGT